MGPAQVTETSGLDIGPHPHIGLQTVTWLIDGAVLHRDSLGSEQVIRPGQLNLMTAGGGVSHSEEATGAYRGDLQGIQLWVAQPERTRHGPAAFEHHSDLPQVELDGAVATVLVGALDGTASPARHDTAIVGVDVDLPAGATTLPLRPGFEYALIVLTGTVIVAGQRLAPGQLGYLGRGRNELALQSAEPTRALLLGGEPWDEPILMWWNFVARTRSEIETAFHDWRDGTDRFGQVASPLPGIPVAPPYWTAG